MVQERNLKCEYPDCTYTTALKSNLNEHFLIKHEGKKPFNCPQCRAEFSKRCNLKAHIDSEHENIRYSCEHCDASYTRKNRLIIHLKKTHKIEKKNGIAKGIRLWKYSPTQNRFLSEFPNIIVLNWKKWKIILWLTSIYYDYPKVFSD